MLIKEVTLQWVGVVLSGLWYSIVASGLIERQLTHAMHN